MTEFTDEWAESLSSRIRALGPKGEKLLPEMLLAKRTWDLRLRQDLALEYFRTEKNPLVKAAVIAAPNKREAELHAIMENVMDLFPEDSQRKGSSSRCNYEPSENGVRRRLTTFLK